MLRQVPGRLANPVWVDDPDFDLAYHVRRSALPRPGIIDQLRELVARIMSRPLDRTRPLWEIYFVEGLEGGRVALLSKSHQILVDGSSTVDLGQVLLDVDPGPRQLVHEGWAPSREQTPGRSGARRGRRGADRAVGGDRHRPQHGRRRSVVRREATAGRLGAVAAALSNRRTTAEYAFNLEPSEQRRVVFVRTALKDYRKVRRVHGGTVNDVILATITGALRAWLMTRAEAVDAGRRLRAVVPMTVIDEELEATSLGSQVVGHLRRPADRRGLARWCACTRSPTRSRPTARPAGRSPPTGSPASPASRRPRSTRSGSRVALTETTATSTW